MARWFGWTNHVRLAQWYYTTRRALSRPVLQLGLEKGLEHLPPGMSEHIRPLFYSGEFGGGLWACRVAGRIGWIGGMGRRRGPDHKAGGASMARAIA
jgi:hypothetical protein